MTRRVYLFDIDGTVADTTHRQHYLDEKPPNWDAFFAACDQDLPIPQMIELAYRLADDEDILFVTGRSEDVRAKTVTWLNATFNAVFGSRLDWIKSEDVYMRAAGDHRADIVVKAELLDRIIADGWTPIMVFEDRSSVVAMWRERGIPCCQVASGEF